MAFIDNKENSISKIEITDEDFKKVNFEPFANNDYWVYKSMDLQKKHLTKDPNGLKLSPKVILYLSQSTDSLSKIFGEPNFKKYNNYIYDIWVVSYKANIITIRQSIEETTYDIDLSQFVGAVHDNINMGRLIEEFMLELLYIYSY